MTNLIHPVKGTRDFYPETMVVRSWLYSVVRAVSESYGYQEYEAPLLESFKLYAAKSGDDLVNNQAYVFLDRGGEQITLRPELTPSLARMIAQRQGELTFPVRWWSFGPFWRYEKMQRGRTREFFQWNIDLLGVDSPEADAELIAIAASFLQAVGLNAENACILVNSRRFMETEFDALRIPQDLKGKVANLVDRREKMEPEAWDENAREIGLASVQLDGLKELLEDTSRWKKSEELTRLFSALEILDINKYVRFDPNIVRGLLYYTGTVFEAIDVSGSLRRAILGGGRYDNLLADVGGNPLSGVGFAMGDVVIGLILKELGLIPSLPQNPSQILVTLFSQDFLAYSMALAADLRRQGLNITSYPEPAKLPKQFKYADKMGIRYVLVIGPDETRDGTVTVKDMKNGTQETLPQAKAIEYLINICQKTE